MWLQGFHFLMNGGKNQRQLAKRADPDGATDTLLQLSLAQNTVAVNGHGSKDCSIVTDLGGHLIVFTNIYESLSKKSPCVWGWYVQMDIARAPPKNPVYERRSSSDCFLQISLLFNLSQLDLLQRWSEKPFVWYSSFLECSAFPQSFSL